ncbi:MAG TPA: phosphoribosylformylglycinamidine synthase subunit PurS [Candidatus Limnocylindria bacterium]|jgi:phosphoribosylformylglycinamidine synthase|nr:phosphoribosylformylglycinamidine synthase subunit PurS [Candidatus Limnocylindria bacterium]
MRFVATIRVLPKSEVRDPQGEAISGALRSLGLAVSDVRTGKEIVVTFDAADETAARDAVRLMGTELLANPVIEDYTYELDLEGAASFEPAPVDDVVYGELKQKGEK